MYTIYHNSNDRTHNFSSFKDQMIQICDQHHNSDRALAFAFILYNFENPHLAKVINDQEYWLALNQISGEHLTVFSLHYKEKIRKKPSIAPMLFSVPIDWNPSYGINKLIEKYFGNTEVSYPAILFFQVDHKSVIDSLLIELKEEEIEKAFLELKRYITSAVDALKKITSENKQNYQEIFDCLEREVESTQQNIKIKRMLKNSGNIFKLISSIKSII